MTDTTHPAALAPLDALAWKASADHFEENGDTVQAARCRAVAVKLAAALTCPGHWCAVRPDAVEVVASCIYWGVAGHPWRDVRVQVVAGPIPIEREQSPYDGPREMWGAFDFNLNMGRELVRANGDEYEPFPGRVLFYWEGGDTLLIWCHPADLPRLA
jgi:hypothetical protein